jgi:hypothetical protein
MPAINIYPVIYLGLSGLDAMRTIPSHASSLSNLISIPVILNEVKDLILLNEKYS